jgi:hypothetical protein
MRLSEEGLTEKSVEAIINPDRLTDADRAQLWVDDN